MEKEKDNIEIGSKKLVKSGLAIAAAVGFILGVNYGPKYEIDGNKVKDKLFTMQNRTLVEYKGEGNKVKYKGYMEKGIKELNAIVINRRMYGPYDTSEVYSKGNERYHHLLEEIDRIKYAEEELRIQNKAQNELEKKLKREKKIRNRANQDLEILKK